jgi:hypothetical protein
MKHIIEYKIYESMTSLPIERYPVNYECTHIYDISDKLEKYGLKLTNLRPKVPTKNEYHDFNFYNFIGKKIQKENTIFPKLRLCDEPNRSKDDRMSDYTDPGSVILLPRYYDSSKDEENHKKYVEDSKNKLIDNFKLLYKGDKLKDAISNIDKHVNFGVSSFEWANIALDKIYEEYKQYFNGNYLRVWSPYDNDTNTSFDDNPGENTEHGYPIRKMLHLSDIEKYLESNYDLSDDLFYQFVIHNNYVENRYWEKPLGLFLDKNMQFIRLGGKYGMDATPTINSMLGILEMEYKHLIQNNRNELFPIYIDYYKKIKDKY